MTLPLRGIVLLQTFLYANTFKEPPSLPKIIMENPFETIQNKLDRITELQEKLISSQVVTHKNNESEIMTIDEASALLSIAKPTIYGYTSSRNIPHFKKGKRLYFIKEDLLKWVQEGKIKTTKEIENDATNYLLKKRRH